MAAKTPDEKRLTTRTQLSQAQRDALRTYIDLMPMPVIQAHLPVATDDNPRLIRSLKTGLERLRKSLDETEADWEEA